MPTELQKNDPSTSVIVVDDHAEDAQAMALALREDGYAVRIAHSAAECLALASVQAPHCVLLDFHMPGTDGLDLAIELRKMFGDDVVLVAVTGYPTDNPRVQETLARVDHHFLKPVFREQFRRLLPPLRD